MTLGKLKFRNKKSGHETPRKVTTFAGDLPETTAEGLNFSASPLFFTYRQLIMNRVAAWRLPAIYQFPETAEEGGFAAYGPRLSQLFVEVMIQQLVKLFHGIKVADIPVEQPTKFELVINLKTTKTLGLTIPDKLLALADEVIE